MWQALGRKRRASRRPRPPRLVCSAQTAEAAAEAASAEARTAARQAEADAASASEQAARLRAELETSLVRHDALEEQLRGGLDERALHAARERGGRGFADGLEVEPDFRLAVEAVLGEVLSGLVLDADAARSLAELPGVIVLRDGRDGRPRAGDRAASRLEERVLEAGGGWLAGAIRRDPDGQAARLLARCAWVPDLETALALRELLPAGWRLVTRCRRRGR